MTSLSHDRPSLEARALAATLIVVGTAEEGPLPQADYSTDPPQVHSQFRVDVEETSAVVRQPDRSRFAFSVARSTSCARTGPQT